MAVNTRFGTAIMVLALLAAEPEETRSSKELGDQLKTNPVVVRRILSALQRGGLVKCQKGIYGGSRLAKQAKEITLAEVYVAVEPNPLFYPLAVSNGYVGKVNQEIDKMFGRAKLRMVEELKRQSLAQIAKLTKRNGIHKKFS